MNREIKFRAFENESGRNRMFEWSEIKKEFQLWLNRNDTFVMQYTGLKDKNGVEIYEGDVVELNEYKRLYEVAFKDAAFKLIHFRNDGLKGVEWGNISRIFEMPQQPTIEIIGDIYSNPELINNNLTK